MSTQLENWVTLVGRPNVGKSTLFNRLVGWGKSLVHNQPGVTRDRIRQETSWTLDSGSYSVTLTDTGGLTSEAEHLFSTEIFESVREVLQQTRVVLFVVDGRAGFLPEDQDILSKLRRLNLSKDTRVIGVVTKVDEPQLEGRIGEFCSLGLETWVEVSAEHCRGIELLKETIAESLVKTSQEAPLSERVAKIPRISIVGRPNVGKSTLSNALVDIGGKAKDRHGQDNVSLTSSHPGTTVDPVDSWIQLNGKDYCLVDTAGIRKKAKTLQGIEVLSIVQARKSIQRSELCLLVVDGQMGVVDQDEKIAGLIEEAGCAVIIVVNKWDTQKNTGFSKEEAVKHIRSSLKFLSYAPIVFTSALHKSGLKSFGRLFEEILSQRRRQVGTHELTEWIRREAEVHNPGNVKFYVCHQAGKSPPSFICRVSRPQKIHFSLKRHLVNSLRKNWGYMGNPVQIKFLGREREVTR